MLECGNHLWFCNDTHIELEETIFKARGISVYTLEEFLAKREEEWKTFKHPGGGSMARENLKAKKFKGTRHPKRRKGQARPSVKEKRAMDQTLEQYKDVLVNKVFESPIKPLFEALTHNVNVNK